MGAPVTPPSKFVFTDAHGIIEVEAHPIAGHEISVTHRTSKGAFVSRDSYSRPRATALADAINRALQVKIGNGW
jgi:hypothetical protein